MKLLRFCAFLFYLPFMCAAYDQAFPKTDVGEFEIKTLPAARLIASQTDAAYFEQNNGFFKRFEVHIPVKAKAEE